MSIENVRPSSGRRNSASEGCREETGGKVLFNVLYASRGLLCAYCVYLYGVLIFFFT